MYISNSKSFNHSSAKGVDLQQNKSASGSVYKANKAKLQPVANGLNDSKSRHDSIDRGTSRVNKSAVYNSVAGNKGDLLQVYAYSNAKNLVVNQSHSIGASKRNNPINGQNQQIRGYLAGKYGQHRDKHAIAAYVENQEIETRDEFTKILGIDDFA
jgi:hypothetical protein